MSLARPTWFSVVLASALGLAVTIVLALLVAQVAYIDGADVVSAIECRGVSHAIALSLGTATFSAALALLVAIAAAYVLAHGRSPGLTIIDALVDVPVVLSPVALGLSLLLFFQSVPGRFIEERLLRFVFEVPGIILAQFILALALQVRVLKSAFEDVDPRLEQVSRSLGLSAAATFRRVTLPLVRPALVAAFLLGWCRALGDFGATAMVAGAVPCKTETIPIAIYLNLADVELERTVTLALMLTVAALVALVAVRVITRGHPR